MKSGSYGNDYASAFLSLTIDVLRIFGIFKLIISIFLLLYHKHLPTHCFATFVFLSFYQENKKPLCRF